MEFYSAIRNEILTFAVTRVDLEDVMLSETSQTKTDRYHMISLVWNLRNNRNERAK